MVFLTVLLMFGMTCSVSAKEYDYILTDEEGKLPIAVAYRPRRVLLRMDTENAYLKSPSDLFIRGDHLYIADTGNDRVLKLDKSFHVEREYTLNDTATPLNGPQGIYVDEWDSLYVADTGNHRVVHISDDGEWIEDFIQPDSALFDAKSYGFSPTKIEMDRFGYLCIINGSDYHGIVKLDATDRFIGYYGTNKVTNTFFDTVIRYFGTEEQKEQYIKKQPPYITNLCVGADGYMYTTNALMNDQEIKRLDQSGSNVYVKNKSFVEEDDEGKGMLSDIHVSDRGIVTVVDCLKQRVYQYDAEGDMLCAFGEKGTRAGTFAYPVAVGSDADGDLYVLDRDNANIQVFEKTAFIQLVHEYLGQYAEGDYDTCYSTLQDVLSIDSTYMPAYRMLGKIYYKQQKYEESMAACRKANDVAGYSQAFDKKRQQSYRDGFVPIVVATPVIGVLLVVFISRTRRRARAKILEGYVSPLDG